MILDFGLQILDCGCVMPMDVRGVDEQLKQETRNTKSEISNL
jgi:hypothetical protein